MISNMQWILLGLMITLISLVLWFFLSRVWLIKQLDTVGPTPWWSLMHLKEGILQPVCNFHSLAYESNKDFIHSWMGPKLVLFAVTPDAAQFVLKNPVIKKYPFFGGASEYVKSSFGNHLLAANDDIWKRHRTFLTSGFNADAYRSYYPTFVDVTAKALDSHHIQEGKDIDASTLLSAFTLDLLCKSIFHYDFKRLDDSNLDIYNSYKTLLNMQTNTIGFSLLMFPWLDKLPIPGIKKIHQSLNMIKSLFERIINDRKEKKYNDILENLLEATKNMNGESGLSENEMISNIWLFFVAGHETTAKALTGQINCLLHYQDIQEKLYQEIITTIGTKSPSLEDLNHLNYLDNFISECLRLYSPVTLIPTRHTTEDTQYKNMVIPKGTIMGISIRGIHDHPDYWPNPKVFDPDRFTHEQKKGRAKFAYMPFSLGLRQCIGNQFSLIEQKLFLVRLLQKYKVIPPKTLPQWDINKSMAVLTQVLVPFQVVSRENQ